MNHFIPRVLYWDIDGTILNYVPEETKPLLAGGTFQQLLDRKGFDQLICVSGWTSLVLDCSSVRGVLSDFEQKEAIREYVQEAFPDCESFHAKVILAADNDDRGRNIDLRLDWWYVDDWAQEFFEKEHGRELYACFAGRRILMCDPNSDGSDIVEWIEGIPNRKREDA